MEITKEAKSYSDYLHGKDDRAKINRRIAEPKLVTMTLSKAKELLKKNWGKQRPISSTKVRDYSKDMKDENFCYGLATIDVAKQLNGHFEYLFNGQHTVSAIITYLSDNNIELENAPKVLVRTHYVEEESELGYLYSRIDIGRIRSFAHRVGATSIDEMLKGHKLSGKVAQAMGAIQVRFKHVGGHKAHARNEIVIENMVELYQEAIKHYLVHYNGCELKEVQNFLSKKVVIGFLLIVLDQSPDKAHEFLELLTSTDFNDELSLLKRHVLNGHYKLEEFRRDTHVVRSLMKFWNAFYRGKDFKRMPSVTDPNEDVKIFGTNWN